MRIGIITCEYPPMRGGVVAYTQILAHELARAGHKVALFTGPEAVDTRFDIEHTPTWNSAILRAIARWADREHLDILNLQYQTAAYGMSPWIHLLPDALRWRRLVVTFHDLRPPYLFPKAGPVRNWAVMRLARRSAGAIVTNHEDAQQLVHLPHCELIPIGSNILDRLPRRFDPQPWRERAGAGPHDYLLAYFGMINHSKGLDTLIEAMNLLRQQRIPVRLVLVGDALGSSDPTNQRYRKAFEAQITEAELAPFVHRTGHLDQDIAIGSYLKAADAVVLPFRDGASYRRGSLMAAIYYGCPIVTTTPRIEIPLFNHRRNMLFVPPDDAPALAETLRTFRHDAELRQRLCLEAENLSHLFNWTQIASHHLNFFRRILSGGL